MPQAYQIVFALYFVSVTAFIVSENRTPKSTFAWTLLFAVLPVVSLGIYLFFGRGTSAFVRKYKGMEQSAPRALQHLIRQVTDDHRAALERFARTYPAAARIATLLHSNNNSRVTTRNEVTVLQDARAAYPAMLAAMEGATASIHLHYYSWNADTFGLRLLELLARKVTEGVEVRILYDPVGSFSMLSRAYLHRARKAGINIQPFSQLWRIHTISYRNHRKIAVIDGRIGFTGGLNIGDEHLEAPEGFARWRDTHIELRGSAVWALQGVFLIDWMNATDEAPDPVPYFAPLPDDAPDQGSLPVQICLSGPDSEYEAIRQLYFEMITSAEREILIQSPFFILDETISDALKMKALSGVKVTVMISSAGPKQYLPYWAANTYVAEVSHAGVEVLMYDAGYLHAKTITIDGRICSIGSANWDIRSFSINYELTAVIYDADIAGQLVTAFDADRAGCWTFDPAEYAARPRLSRFRDSLARLAAPLL